MNWVERHPAIFYPGAAASVANTIYLAFVSFESFMLGTDLPAREADSRVLLLASIVYFLSLYVFRQPAAGASGRRERLAFAFVFLPVSIVVLAFASAMVWLLHTTLASDAVHEVKVLGPLLIEIASLAFLVGRYRDRMVRRQLLIFLFWAASILAGFCAIGVYEQLSGSLLGNPLTLAFCSILFHLANACYLFYGLMLGGLQSRLMRH